MRFCLILLLFFSSTLLAKPRQVYVWFLSAPTVGYQFPMEIEWSAKLVTNEHCEKVEGGCFDPQAGWVEPRKKIKPLQKADLGAKAFLAKKIICDPHNPFDIYCGKEKKILQQKVKTALWIDVSGSMKSVDWSSDKRFCQRRKVAELFLQKCSKFSQISIFDTSLREVGSVNTTCTTRGTNNTLRMIHWIERSRADELYILTDVEENNMEFSTFLEKIHANIFGGRAKNIFLSDFLNYVKTNHFNCQ